MNPNFLIKASPEGALPIASTSDLTIFEFSLQRYLQRYLSLTALTQAERVNNLPIIEDELATMLGKLHAANVPDYKARAEMVARELHHKVRVCRLDQPTADTSATDHI
ncbi:MAG: hypothetical protein HZA88_00515 [Verrucomicrobia bacterium]|nr:hypothetical protein [Verrucomicrobiota bacterium]